MKHVLGILGAAGGVVEVDDVLVTVERTIIGALGMFNGFCITLLAYMTEFGVTTEVTAKWAEIGVTPESAAVRRSRARASRSGNACCACRTAVSA